MKHDEPEKELAKWKKRVPAPDYAAMKKPGRLQDLDRVVREAMHQGTKGPAWDARLYVREFDFRLDEVRLPVKLFHGEQDLNAPIALARRVATELPNAKIIAYENDAHLSTLCNHFDEIGQALLKQ